MVRLLSTGDGSSSLYHAELHEGYHSSSGAMTESLEKFSRPLIPFVKKKKLRVLDTCFGIGYRSCGLLLAFPECDIEIVGIEIDPALFSVMRAVIVPEEASSVYRVLQELSVDHSEVSGRNFSCEVLTGDFRKMLPKLQGKFDIILHDPFSPAKVPELWSKRVFKELYELLVPGGVLSTYSSATMVREHMRHVGFVVKNGPAVGRRKPSTIALKPLSCI